MEKRPEELVREQITQEIGNESIVLGYFEHQVDLLMQVVKDLAGAVDTEQLSEDAKQRLGMVDQLLAHTSVDLAHLDSPYQAYKIPKAIETKKRLRTIQAQYLTVKAELGEL